MKRMLCFGDSNVWGRMPGIAYGDRWDENTRWTGVCQNILGPEYKIIEEGLNGRTTVFDDPYFDYRNGEKALGYTLLSQKPLDMAVIGLGGNDLKFTDAKGSAAGLKKLMRQIRDANVRLECTHSKIFAEEPKILVLSALACPEDFDARRPNSLARNRYEEQAKLIQEQKKAAQDFGADFLDMSLVAEPSLVDCMHMDAENHIKYGKAVAAKILEIFARQD